MDIKRRIVSVSPDDVLLDERTHALTDIKHSGQLYQWRASQSRGIVLGG